MKSARPTTSQMCFAFSKYGILDFGYSKHLSEILFCLFQTFIRDLVLSVPKIRIIDLRIISKMQTLKFLISAFPKHWNSGFRLSQYWNSGFWPSKLWNSPCWFFPNIRIQCFGLSKHWNSLFWLFHNMDFLILSFSKH